MTTVKDEYGEGRYLIAENMGVGPLHFKHPDRDADDDEHLNLGPLEAEAIDELWLGARWFINYVEQERVRLYRSDRLPDKSLTVTAINADFEAKGFERPIGNVAFYICGMDPIPPEYDQYIELEPSQESKRQYSDTFITPRWDLLRNHLPWLREVLALEKRWRNRRKVVNRLETRIKELESRRP